MHTSKTVRLITVLIAGALLSACSILPSFGKAERTAEQVYFLNPSLAISPDGEGQCGQLQISDIIGAPGFRGARMLYSTEAFKLENYAYSRWADNPARMLSVVLREGLEAGGYFSLVVSGASIAPPDLRLQISDLKVLQEFDHFEAPQSSVSITAHARIYQVQPARLVGAQAIELSQIAPPNPKGGAQALNALSGELVGELQRFLVSHCGQ